MFWIVIYSFLKMVLSLFWWHKNRKKYQTNNYQSSSHNFTNHCKSFSLFVYLKKAKTIQIKNINSKKEADKAKINFTKLKDSNFTKIKAISAKNDVKRMLNALFNKAKISLILSFIKIILTQKYKISKGLRWAI